MDGVVPLGHHPAEEDGTVRVELRLDDGTRCVVHVRPRRLAEVRLTSCSGTSGAPSTFDLVALHRDEEVAARA